MKKQLTKQELIEIVKVQIKTFGSQRTFAAHCKISAAYLNDFLQNRREPGEKILTALGFTKTIPVPFVWRDYYSAPRGSEKQ